MGRELGRELGPGLGHELEPGVGRGNLKWNLGTWLGPELEPGGVGTCLRTILKLFFTQHLFNRFLCFFCFFGLKLYKLESIQNPTKNTNT